ncbi:hypothetical protein LTR53_014634 [Teratosphaeriaceae sp. CCFEE 6253]|nr:hypothetical protein LTR53_014634 [Teratosphaeriaceae sp. CCFEE 6253]
MPHWRIYHPEGVYRTVEEKSAFVKDINAYYHIKGELPAFYVIVNFIAQPPGTMFRGYDDVETLDDPFVRISISHMAAHRGSLPGLDGKRFRAGIDAAIKKMVVDRGYHYEYTVVEESRDMWMIDAFVPPPLRSETEAMWRKEGKVSAYEGAQ